MITYRFRHMNGRMYEATVNRIDNALPEIQKRIEHQLERMERENEKRSINVQSVQRKDHRDVR